MTSLSVDEFRERLKPLLESQDGGAVVFDADGTLWSHDVGCMVFEFAAEQKQFREESCVPLQDFARREGVNVPPGASASELARHLLSAWYAGKSGERTTAEMQVWAYVGMTEAEFRALTREAMEHKNHFLTVFEPIVELAEWVRATGARSYIVSASPLWAVQEATKKFGFDESEIAAGIPNTRVLGDQLVIEAGMARPLPYGPAKVTAGEALLNGRPWIAALGDSAFDIEMMKRARLAGGLGQKESMLTRLKELPHGYRIVL